MIITKTELIFDTPFKLTYSDQNKKIVQLETGIIYEDALDHPDSNYSYQETEYNLDQESPATIQIETAIETNLEPAEEICSIVQ